jgi:glycosyltransferase involved in cell wall biosynthesis
MTDADDPILGFATRWVRALARRVASVQVITMFAGRVDVPPNVRVASAGREKGYTKARRVWEFYGHLGAALRRGPVDGCFSHMMPLFSALAGPFLRARRIPVVTWYAHPSLTRTLKLAHWLSNRMVTSLPQAYPYRHDKLSVIGQGIDGELFRPGGAPEDPPVVLCAGRLSPVKDHPTLLKATALLRGRWPRPFRVEIMGQEADEAGGYVASLRSEIRALGMEDVVRLVPPVAQDVLPASYQKCCVHVNLTPAGFGDKVALEAMSCGRPCVVANEGFRETLGEYADRLTFRHGDPEDLAERLRWALELGPEEHARVGGRLREQVMAQHGIDRLADRIVSELEHLRGRR